MYVYIERSSLVVLITVMFTSLFVVCITLVQVTSHALSQNMLGTKILRYLSIVRFFLVRGLFDHVHMHILRMCWGL